MKITHIFFDLGKVLVDFDFDIAVREVLKKSPLTHEQLSQEFYRAYGLIDDYECGRISSEVFFQSLKDGYQYEGPAEELRGIWCGVFTPLDNHILMARSLAEFYPLAIISNTSEAHIDHLEATYDFFPVFRKRFYSYKLGVMKPDYAIYDTALREMEADKYESLFIDDREENIEAAATRGWQTIHLRPDVNLRDALRSYDLRGV
jgi:FMN phosphatase YigB (HAD superfamily)